jgi:hypothetical protein
MKRFTIALAALAGLSLFAGRVSADPGGFAPPGGAAGGASFGQIGGPGTLIGAGDLPPGQAPDCYGWSPSIKKFFGKFKRGGHGHDCGGGASALHGGKNPLNNPANWGPAGYGVGGPAYNPNGFPPGTNPMMQGTLAFPHHSFVRSPRDFFMLDLNK